MDVTVSLLKIRTVSNQLLHAVCKKSVEVSVTAGLKFEPKDQDYLLPTPLPMDLSS